MTHVIVPVAILEGGSISMGLMDLLQTVDVTVLGYHVLPEQTPPDQARVQYEERANAALEDLADEFRESGGEAHHRLVFTQDRAQSIQRVAEESNADAFAITGATGDVNRILVPIMGEVAPERILGFLDEVIGDRAIDITLLLAAEDEATGSATLTDAEEIAVDHGLDVETKLILDTAPLEALIAALPNHDVIVMGEQAPSVGSFLFGEVTERVAAESIGPVLVVRRDPDG